MKAKGAILGLALLMVLLAVLPFASCAAEEETPTPTPTPTPGPEVTSVSIPCMICLTGVYAGVVEDLWPGMNLAKSYYNEKFGGIEGYPIEYKFADTGYKAERALSIYERFKAAKPRPIMMIASGSPDGAALKPKLKEDKIPILNFGQSAEQIFPPAYNFLWGVPYPDAFARWLEWLRDTRAKEETVKVGIIGYESGWVLEHRDVLEQGAPAYGLEAATLELVSAVPVDVSATLLKFKDAGVNEVYVCLPPPGAHVTVTNWHDLGLKEDMNLTGFWWTGLENIVRTAGDKAEGYRILSSFFFSEADAETNPKVKEVTDYWYDTLFQPGPPDQTMYCGFLGMEVVFKAISVAIQEKGGDLSQVTGEDVYNAFGTFTGWEGVLHPPTTLKEGEQCTFKDLKVYEAQRVGEDLIGVDISGPITAELLPRLPGKPDVDWDAWSP